MSPRTYAGIPYGVPTVRRIETISRLTGLTLAARLAFVGLVLTNALMLVAGAGAIVATGLGCSDALAAALVVACLTVALVVIWFVTWQLTERARRPAP
jgi:hypothetical protein